MTARSKVEVGDREARYYDKFMSLFSLGRYSNVIKTSVQKMDIRPGQSILDLGSGTGKNDCFIAEKLGTRGKLVGLDISDEMLSQARKRCYKYSNVFFEKQRIEQGLPYKEKFDKVFISFVLHGFEDEQKQQIIHSALQALKPGGSFYILDYSEFNLEKLWLPLRRAFIRWECQLAAEFLKLNLRDMLQKHGFNDFEEVVFFKGHLRFLKAVKGSTSIA